MKRNRPELVLEGLIMLNWNMNHFLKFQLLKNSCFLALYTGFGCLLSDQIRWQLGWILKLPEAKCGGIWSQFWRLVTSLRTNDVAGSGGGDTRPRYPPKGDVGLTISLQIFEAQLARLLLEFLKQNFILHPTTEVRFRSWSRSGGSPRH